MVELSITWRLHAERRVDTMTAFASTAPADDEAESGPDVSIIGSWNTAAGVAACGSADVTDRWALDWASPDSFGRSWVRRNSSRRANIDRHTCAAQ